jgi:hypothetical protein
LLLAQAERLHARLTAADGNWPDANVLFAQTLGRAMSLGLPLEVARTQAAWGEAAILYSLTPAEGHRLLAEARTTLAACDARAELKAITAAQF